MSKLFSLFAPKETKDQKQFKLEREFSARGHQTDNIAKFIDDELDSLDKHTKVAMDVDGMDWHLEPVSPRRSNATSTPSMSPRIQSVPVSPRSAAESANYSANKTTSAEWLSELRYAHIVPNSPKMEPLKIEAPTVLKSVVRATTASGSEVDICPTVDAYLAQRAVVKSSGSLEGYRSTSVREIEESCRVQDTMWDPFNLTASQASDLQVISDQILNEQKNNVIAKLQLSASQRSIRPKSTILKDLKLDLSALNLDDAQTPTSPRSNDTPTSPRDAPINGNHLFEREGVHVSLLSKFIEFWGGKDVLNVAACAYVRDNLMKEATKETNLSFRDFWKPILIQEDSANARLFGPAKEYIVYHPNMQFLEFAETLQKRYESKSADTYLYIDMFCMNLNSPLANDFDTLTNTTRMITRSIPETVLVFHKSLTDESSVLSNPLTLYQMYYAAERKSYCDIALTIKARKAIFDNLFFRFDDIYKSILENKIEAYVKDSSPQSHALASFLNTLISNGEPLSLINSKVAYQFRGALIRFLKRALSDRPTEETEISLKVALGKCYKLDQAFAKAEPLFKVSYDYLSANLGFNDPQALDALHHLATSIDEQLRYAESAPLLTLCLTRRRKVLGDTDVDTLATIKAFAIHYNNQKLYDKGGPLLIEYTRGIRDVLGKDYKDSMQAVMLLSSLYAEIRKFKRAEPLFRDNIYRQQKIAGKVHPDTLKMKNSLALMYWNEKRYAEAEQIYLEIVEDHNRCLDFIESVKSKRDDPSRIPTVENINHHDVLKYISNCALVYREQGKFDKSTPLLNDCYVKFRNMLGEGHADTIKAAGNLGKQYMENGEFEKSESILSNCYEVSRTQLGETHLSTLKCISNLSELYLRTNQFELALPLLSTYIPARKSSLTKNFTASHFGSEYHPEILRATYNLGRVYAGRGAHDDAEILLMDCLSKRQKKLGSSHPDTILSMSIISEFFYLQQRYEEAEMPSKECVKQLRRRLGDVHYECLLRVNILSCIYTELIDIDKNEQLLRTVVPVLVDTNPSDSSAGITETSGVTLTDYNVLRLNLLSNFAVLLTAQKNYLEAEAYIETSLNLFRQSFGVNDPRTLVVESNAAIYSIHARDYIEAERRLVASLDRQRQILGPGNTDTLNTEFILGCLLLFRKRYGEAEPLLVHAYESMKESLGGENEQTQMAGTFLVELLKKLPPNVE